MSEEKHYIKLDQESLEFYRQVARERDVIEKVKERLGQELANSMWAKIEMDEVGLSATMGHPFIPDSCWLDLFCFDDPSKEAVATSLAISRETHDALAAMGCKTTDELQGNI